MKICMLTDDPSSIGGGPEHIRHLVHQLSQYDCQVDVITPLTMNPKFNLHNFWQRIKFTFWVLSFLLTTSYNIYHSHTFSTTLFLPLAKLFGKKVGMTVHGAGQSLIGGGFLNRTLIPQFLRWLVLDVWPLDFRLSASHLPGFVFVGNGVDLNEFKNLKRLLHKDFTVLCVSRDDPVKGVTTLKKAVKKLSGVKLHLVSGRRRTVRDFSQSDLYVLPSLSEGFPVVLLEAMAAKLPIVATDVGDCRELVEESRSGLVVLPGDPVALAKAIVQMQKRGDRQKLGENGYNFVKGNYTWEKVAQKAYATYQKVLSQ